DPSRREVQVWWESRSEAALSAWQVSFDGAALEVADPRRFPLPRHRDGVVLIVSGAEEDFSRIDPASARAYLEALGVPFWVWSIRTQELPGWGTADRWGPSLGAGLEVVRNRLDRQHIAL